LWGNKQKREENGEFFFLFFLVAGTKIAAHHAAHLFELFFLGIKYKGFFRNEIDQSHRFRPCPRRYHIAHSNQPETMQLTQPEKET
jgi:hypothetical protein